MKRGSRQVTLMLKSQNRLIDDSDNDDSDFDEPNEEETKDNFQTQSIMRKSTRLMKFQTTQMIKHGSGGHQTNELSTDGIIADVEEYDHNDPNFDPSRVSHRPSSRKNPANGILKSN